MVPLCSDENMDQRVVEELRRLNHDIVTARDAGQANQKIPDPDVLAFAIGLGRAVLTFNRRDFRRLHASNPNHHGIIACTDDPDRIGLAQRIHTAVTSRPDLDGHIVLINRPNPP